MESTMLIWLLVGIGFLPWRIKRCWEIKRQGRRWQQWASLEISAVFWRLSIAQRPQGLTWHLSLPLIARCKAAIWSALQTLLKV